MPKIKDTKEEVKKISVFCANEQSETEHTLDINGVGEIVLECACGRFLKLPKGTDAEGVKAFIEAHKQANEGQITKESIEEEKKKLLDELVG